MSFITMSVSVLSLPDFLPFLCAHVSSVSVLVLLMARSSLRRVDTSACMAGSACSCAGVGTFSAMALGADVLEGAASAGSLGAVTAAVAAGVGGEVVWLVLSGAVPPAAVIMVGALVPDVAVTGVAMVLLACVFPPGVLVGVGAFVPCDRSAIIESSACLWLASILSIFVCNLCISIAWLVVWLDAWLAAAWAAALAVAWAAASASSCRLQFAPHGEGCFMLHFLQNLIVQVLL